MASARHLLRPLLAMLLCLPALALALALDWPQPTWPAEARPELVAADSVLNGKHSRIWQARLSGTRAEAEQFFSQQLGAQRVRQQLRGNTVLAARQGDFFITVQLKEQLGQVQAQVMATSLREPVARSRALQDTLSWLPPETGVVQTLESSDEGRRGLTVTAMGQSSIEHLGDALSQHLRRRGWQPRQERVMTGAGRQALQISAQGNGEDVLVIVADQGDHRSVVIQRNKEARP